MFFFGRSEAIEIKEDVFGFNRVRSLGGNQEAKCMIALTFDDAPNGYTREILQVLKEKKVKATFFLIGSQVKKYPEVAREIVKQGHEIGNHSYSHRIDESFTLEEILEDLQKAEKVIKDATGVIPSYFRPPRGFTNGKIREACGLMGYSIIMWWVDSRDWELEDEAILEGVRAHVRPGGIILFHSLPQTVRVLPRVIEELEEKKYTLVTVSDLLGG
ncbi:MAG: polysaccharide deacetylase family protein [Candidatus Caldatribacteriaceae bacterium]